MITDFFGLVCLATELTYSHLLLIILYDDSNHIYNHTHEIYEMLQYFISGKQVKAPWYKIKNSLLPIFFPIH